MQISTKYTDLEKVTKYISYTQLLYSISYLEKDKLDHGTTGYKIFASRIQMK